MALGCYRAPICSQKGPIPRSESAPELVELWGFEPQTSSMPWRFHQFPVQVRRGVSLIGSDNGDLQRLVADVSDLIVLPNRAPSLEDSK